MPRLSFCGSVFFISPRSTKTTIAAQQPRRYALHVDHLGFCVDTACQVLCEDYTVYVRGLPRDCTTQDIANFFTRFGTVLYVERPHENKPFLDAARRLDVLKQKVRSKKGCCSGHSKLERRVAAAEARVAELHNQIFKPTNQAFVTFQYQYEADACELRYRR